MTPTLTIINPGAPPRALYAGAMWVGAVLLVILLASARLQPPWTPAFVVAKKVATPLVAIPRKLAPPVPRRKQVALTEEVKSRLIARRADLLLSSKSQRAAPGEVRMVAPLIHVPEPPVMMSASRRPSITAQARTPAPEPFNTPILSGWNDYVAAGMTVQRVPEIDALMDSFEPYRIMLQRRQIALVFSATSKPGETALFWSSGEVRPADGILSADLGPWLRLIANADAVPELADYMRKARIFLGLDPTANVVVHVKYNQGLRLAILGKLARAIELRHHRSIDDAAKVTYRLFNNSQSAFDIELENVRFRN